MIQYSYMNHILSSLRRRSVFLFLIATLILIVGLIIYKIYDTIDTRQLDAESVTLSSDLSVAFGSEAKVSDFLTELKGELVEDFTIKTDQLGEQEVHFEYINLKNRQRPAHFTVNIIDKTPPLIYGRKAYTVPKDYGDDLTDLMLSGDDLDDHPKREIIGEYNLHETGSYALEYVITDSSNNQSREPFTLHVIEPTKSTTATPSTSTATAKIPLSSFITDHKTKDTKIGIDVSHWQGDIDWPTIKNAGVEFAFIRLGYQTEFGGEYKLDKYAKTNLEKATRAQIPIGVYFYSYANSLDEAKRQATWVIEQVKDYPLELGIAFDWENWSEFNQANLSFHSLHQVANEFIQTAENAGYIGSLYGSKNYLETLWQPLSHRTWLAQYHDHVTYSGNYWIWQISDHGRVPGISGDVDIDIMYLDH